MKNLTHYFSISIILFLFFSCNKNTSEEVEAVWPNGVMYEIFVQSYADSDGDGIGDFKGLTTKLDYIKDLGVQGIWLMPISPSPSYHKYDVTDYYGIHPDYGTIDDFKNFVSEAHKRDIKIVIDFVINHSSSEHKWFKESKKDPDNKYRDYYVWANIDDVKHEIAKKETTHDSDNITQWHQNGNDEKYYYGFFWQGMPDLNFDNKEVRKEIIKTGKYWLEEIGIDGFRLDAARHIFPDDQAGKSHDWWIEFGNAMRKIKPDVYMVGEVWGTAETVGPFYKGLSSLFNFNLHFKINDLLKTEVDNGIIDSLVNHRNVYSKYSQSFLDGTFYNNHDVSRLISNFNGNINKHKQALAILLTLPGTPYIYYGDEIGMLGKKPDEMIREPFLWNVVDYDKYRTNWIKPVNSTDSTVIPLSAQLKDKNSTYHFFKEWIKHRNENKIIMEGKLNSLKVADNLLAYSRSLGENKVVVLHNLTGNTLEQPLNDLKCNQLKFFYGSKKPAITNNIIKLEAYQSVILQ